MLLPEARLFSLAAVTLAAAALAVWVVREVAHRRQLLDRPNERSAHSTPTPRLGGLGIMVAFLGAATAWTLAAGDRAALPVVAATALVSALGLVDDLWPLPARVRFGVQAAAAVGVVWARQDALAGASLLLPLPPWALASLAVLWMVWMTNLYNFMDGIDGLAAGQALLACLGLSLAAGGTAGALLLLLAAASAGFLLFNFPPASIFMGDVGSTAIGFFLAAVPLLPAGRPVVAEAVWVACGLFILDATTTLVRRVRAGERWYQAHRTHWYQRPLAHGVRHRTITLTAWAGMLPLAAAAALLPSLVGAARAALLALPVLVFLPLVVAVRRLERRASSAGPR